MNHLLVFIVGVTVCAQIDGYGVPSGHKGKLSEHGVDHQDYHGDYYAHPKYSFEYGVNDHKTNDEKEHWEVRDGDKVTGGYKLKEADGTYRVVEYTADKHNGFNAVVHTIGKAEHSLEHKSLEHKSGYDKSFGYQH